MAATSGQKSLFAVGDTVRHKKYGFRGVVLAWDPTPVTDVSHWDGLQDIANPQSQPFYQIIPDQNDCRNVFGGERSMRYVCQENLERLVTAVDIAGMKIDMEGQDWQWQPDCQRYEAPAMVRFQHGEDLGDNGRLHLSYELFEDAINAWQFQAQRRGLELDSTLQKLSITNILQLLQAVDNVADATVVEDLVKEMRKAHPDKMLRTLLEHGSALLVAGQAKEAHKTLTKVLAQDAEYAEAWNKLGSTEYLMGNYTQSLTSTEKALELDPFHFQASNGMGLILFQQQDYRQAAYFLRKSLKLDPWASVSSKLSICVDFLSRMMPKEER